MNRLNVCLSPLFLPLFDVAESLVVLIDVFRASTSICYAIQNGAKAIIPVADVTNCECYRVKTDHLLAAERDSKKLVNFHLGNAPSEFTEARVKDKTIVLTTTNGTQAIQAARLAKEIIIASFRNLNAVCSHIKDSKIKQVILLCSGWKNNFSLEDTLLAGAIAEKLDIKLVEVEVCDASTAAIDLYKLAKKDIKNYLNGSAHAKRLKKLAEDIIDTDLCLKMKLTESIDMDLCLELNVMDSLPIVKNEAGDLPFRIEKASKVE